MLSENIIIEIFYLFSTEGFYTKSIINLLNNLFSWTKFINICMNINKYRDLFAYKY